MAAKVGNTDVSFRLGATTPAAVYLGSEQVWSAVSVPGAPTILSAYSESGTTYIEFNAPASDGGSAVTTYTYYFNSVAVTADSFVETVEGFLVAEFAAGYLGQDAQVSATNAVGEGQKSSAVEVTSL